MPGLGPDRPLKVAAPGREAQLVAYLSSSASFPSSDGSKMKKKSTHCREKSLYKSFGGTLFTRTCPLVRPFVRLSGILLCT